MDAKTSETVREAERLLAIRSYDAAHDLAHHRSVLAAAQDIATHVTEQYDANILEIACMWHDVVVKDYEQISHKQVTQDTAEYLKKWMLDQDFTKVQAETAFLAVKHHEFDDKPVNTEGRILFDADKLDNLNLARIRRFIASDRLGNVPKWKIKAYIKGGTAIIKLTRNKLHFDYSKQLFDKIVNELWDDKEIAKYAEKYKVNLGDIKKSLRKTTILDRIIAALKK